MELHIDLLSIVIATILSIFIFLCWYSKWLFGSMWIQHSAKSELQKKWWQRVAIQCILSFVIAYFLAFFDSILQVTSVGDAMFSSLCLWLGFVLPTQLFSLLWHRTSGRVFWIETGYMLLSLLVMGGIIGA
jgi:hypothetical protein